MDVLYNILIVVALILTIIAIIKFVDVIFIKKTFDKLSFIVTIVIYALSLALIVFLAEVASVSLIRSEFKRNIENAKSLIIENDKEKHIIPNDSLFFYKNYLKRIKSRESYDGPNEIITLTIIKENGKEKAYFIGLENGKYIGNVIWISKNGWFNMILIGVIERDDFLYKYFLD